MSEKRFFEIDYDEVYYIIDSLRLQRKKTAFEDEEEYQEYCLENSLMGTQVVDLLNSLVEENEQLKKEHKIAIDEMITDYKELEKENEQLIKMGLKWQGENPCATCVYPDPNVQKLCCAYVSPILTEEARESFVQGLCVNYKRIRGL